MSFNFGSSSGAAAAGQTGAFTGFGAPAAAPATTSATGSFGAGLFGTTTSTAGAGFGFGQPATSAAAANPFNTTGAFGGAPATSTALGGAGGFAGFGAAPATSTAGTGMFAAGGLGTAGLGGGFGGLAASSAGAAQPTQTGSFGFGSSFGGAATLQTGAGAFGAAGGSLFGAKPATTTAAAGQFQFSGLGQPARPGMLAPAVAAQPAHREVDPNTFLPKLFNDERDRILGEFNKLQACWGAGKGFFAPNQPPVEFNQQQSTHKFKAIGFSEIRAPADEETNKIDVLVKCENGAEQLKTTIPQYEANLRQLFGQQFNVKVESSKALSDGKAFLSISVVDTTTNKKLPSFQLLACYEQAQVRQQFHAAFGGALVELIRPLTRQEIEDYLKLPPSGIDPLVWARAKSENPDPKKFIPVALVGFGALNSRFKSQVQETEQQQLRLQIIGEEVGQMQRDVNGMRAKVEECKRRNRNLGNRVLKTMAWQEVRRKKGYPILAEEDELRAKLESIQSELNAPTKYKGCLNELICKLRHMQSQRQSLPKFALEDGLMKELQTHLSKEQQGVEYLLQLVKNDLQDLKAIKGRLTE